jgi:ABC-type Fe3+ transport system substrate-binding protein
MQVALHPSQTVGRFAAREARQPAVSIVPYFFSKMTPLSRTLEVVWPEDGAIVSPIFMLVRDSGLPAAAPAAELFLSREVGEILAHRGLFPTTHPYVDNKLPPEARLEWLGWDFIHEHDIGALIPRLGALFSEQAEVAS